MILSSMMRSLTWLLPIVVVVVPGCYAAPRGLRIQDDDPGQSQQQRLGSRQLMQDVVTTAPGDGIMTFSPTTVQPSFAPLLTASPTVLANTASPLESRPSFVTTAAPVVPATNAPVGDVGAPKTNAPTLSPSAPPNAVNTPAPSKAAMTSQPSLVGTNPPTSGEPTLAPTTASKPTTSAPSSPALYRVPLTAFSVTAADVQNPQQLQITMGQYLLAVMDVSSMRLVELAPASTTRRSLQTETVFSYIGSVLLTDKTQGIDVPLAQQRALEDKTAVQQAVDANADIGTNVVVSSILLASTIPPPADEESSSMNIILIAGCAAGGALLCIIIAVGLYMLYSKPPPPPDEYGKKLVNQAHHDPNEDESLAPPPPPMEEDMDSVAGYSLASAATEQTPVQPARTRRLIPDAAAESDNESTFDYDQVGFKDHLGHVMDQDDSMDIEPDSFYGNFSPNTSLLAAAPAVAMSPIAKATDEEYDSDVPSDERNLKTDQDLTGFDLAKTGPRRVLATAPSDEVMSSIAKKEGLKGTIFGGSLRKKAVSKPKVSKSVPPEKATEELDSLSSFLKGRRDAKLASRKSS